MNKDNLQRSYSLLDKMQLCSFLFRTKLLNRHIRLIRYPFIVRGKQYIDWGKALTTGHWCRFEVYPNNSPPHKRLFFGNNIQVNDFVHICAIEHVEIGDNCLLASHIYISDNSHGRYEGSEYDSPPEVAPAYREYITAPVKIGKNCWLGEGVIVLPGVTIGDGCIIGAHSIVKKNIPPFSIAVGSPAKVVKRFDFQKNKWVKI